MWPISTRVNKPENDDPSIAEPVRIERACGIVAVVDRPFCGLGVCFSGRSAECCGQESSFYVFFLGTALLAAFATHTVLASMQRGLLASGNVRQSARTGNER
jgi:hypothetical protein